MPSLPFPLPSGVGDAGAARDARAATPGRDLEIDADSELVLVGGDLVVCRDEVALKQNVDIALNLHLGEFYLDLEEGVPYLDRILVKSPDLAAIKSILSNAILKVEGIVAVPSLVLDFDRGARTLSGTWSAQYDLTVINGTISGELTINV